MGRVGIMKAKYINGVNLSLMLQMIAMIGLNTAFTIYISNTHREIGGIYNFGNALIIGYCIGGMLRPDSPKWSRVVMGLMIPAFFVFISFIRPTSLSFDLSQINALERTVVIILWMLTFVTALRVIITTKYYTKKSTKKIEN